MTWLRAKGRGHWGTIYYVIIPLLIAHYRKFYTMVVDGIVTFYSEFN